MDASNGMHQIRPSRRRITPRRYVSKHDDIQESRLLLLERKVAELEGTVTTLSKLVNDLEVFKQQCRCLHKDTRTVTANAKRGSPQDSLRKTSTSFFPRNPSSRPAPLSVQTRRRRNQNERTELCDPVTIDDMHLSGGNRGGIAAAEDYRFPVSSMVKNEDPRTASEWAILSGEEIQENNKNSKEPVNCEDITSLLDERDGDFDNFEIIDNCFSPAVDVTEDIKDSSLVSPTPNFGDESTNETPSNEKETRPSTDLNPVVKLIKLTVDSITSAGLTISTSDKKKLLTSRPWNAARGDWKCHRCYEIFRTCRDLDAHIVSEPNCVLRKKMPAEKKVFPVVSKHTARGDWKCSRCPEILRTSRLLAAHKQSNHKCERKPKKKILKVTSNHSKHTPRSGWKCNRCLEIFGTWRDLIYHKKIHGVVKKGTTAPFGNWKCKHCSGIFRTWRERFLHIQIKHSRKPKIRVKRQDSITPGKNMAKGDWKCNYCSEICRTSRDLAAHKQIVHRNNEPWSSWSKKRNRTLQNTTQNPKTNWTCKKCSDIFKTRFDLETHKSSCYENNMKRRRPRKPCSSVPTKCGLKSARGDWKCCHCDKVFRTSRERSTHNKICHLKAKKLEKAWICRDCNKLFETQELLNEHRKDCIPDRDLMAEGNSDGKKRQSTGFHWKCTECEAAFKGHKLWIHHMEKDHFIAEGTAELKCPKCDTEFPSQNLLLVHIQSQHMQNPWGCKKCEARFPTSKLLIAHRKEAHIPKKICDICNYKSVSSTKLKKHFAQVHSDERPFLCNLCGYTSKIQEGLKTHVKLMHEPRTETFICKYCGNSFNRLANLRIHEQIHEGKRDKICPHCKRSVRNLKDHIREIHEKLRPFECHLCEHKFKKSSHLQRHVRTHQNPNRRIKSYHVDRGIIRKSKRHVICMRISPNAKTGPQHRAIGVNVEETGKKKTDSAEVNENSNVEVCGEDPVSTAQYFIKIESSDKGIVEGSP